MADPVVICGMAVRLPGGVTNTGEFWQLLVNKKSGHIPIPRTRFNVDGFYSENTFSGSIQHKGCYFFDPGTTDLGHFDSSYFTCGEREICSMDPAQRQLLEIARECLDNAGEANWRGKRIGCYVGNFSSDWQDQLAMDQQASGIYRGSAYIDILQANRISYEYDWRGPSMLVKTGCSSSMVALHLAAQAVVNGECSSAMALGVNVITSTGLSTMYTEMGVLSPSGKCKTFDILADGYGRGEAVNAVYVKRLSDALRDGNPVRAIVRATGTNNDGHGNGILVPHSAVQKDLIRNTYRAAGIPDEDLGKTAFFECHGTGTNTGDPLEVGAVADVWKDHGGIMVGGVKPNVGHGEGAAGLTSVIKCVLALENNIIPPNINIEKLNPKIPWDEAHLSVPLEPTPWPQGREKRMSVNSFGITGSNAHVILESYKGSSQVERPASADSGVDMGTMATSAPRLLLFSTSHPKSLQQHVERHKAYIESNCPNQEKLDNLAYTLAYRREHMPCRSYAVADLDGMFNVSQTKRVKASASPRRIVFVFTGQGAHWPAMGAGLLQKNKVFAQSLRRLDTFLQSLPAEFRPDWTLEEELTKGAADSRVGELGYSHPCATAVQICLTDVLAEQLNIRPGAVIGHSAGEVAAAYAAGSLSAEQAMACSYFRGWILRNGPNIPSGTMAAVHGLSSAEIKPLLLPGVHIACINSPLSLTLAGDPALIQNCVEHVQRWNPNVTSKFLAVETPFHSPYMEPLGDPYCRLLESYLGGGDEGLTQQPAVPYFSSLMGKEAKQPKFNAEYWRHNFVEPVLFHDAMRSLLESDPHNMLIEIGPHPALQKPIEEALASFQGQGSVQDGSESIFTQKRGEDGQHSLLRLAGELFSRDIPMELSGLVPIQGRQVLTDMPTYSWLHDKIYMEEPRNAARYKHRPFPRHPLLGARVIEGTDIEPAWRNMLDLKEVSWMADHVVDGQVVFPAAGFLALIGEAMRQTAFLGSEGADGQAQDGAAYTIRNMVLNTALVVSRDKKTEMFTRMIPEDCVDEAGHRWHSFRVMSCADGRHWVSHAQGKVRSGAERQGHEGDDFAKANASFPRQVDAPNWYASVKNKLAIDFGHAFQGLDDMTTAVASKEASCTVYDYLDDDTGHYIAHPVLLDCMLQLTLLAMSKGLQRNLGGDRGTPLPTHIDRVSVLGKQDLRMRGYARILDDYDPTGGQKMTARSAFFTDEGEMKTLIEGLRFSELHTSKSKRSNREVPLISYPEWERDITLSDPSSSLESVLDLREANQEVQTHLGRLIALLGWKYPDSRVLQIGGTSAGDIQAARVSMEALHPAADRRFYSAYTYACAEEDEQGIADLRNKLADGDYRIAGIEQISLQNGVDIVLISTEVLFGEDELILSELEILSHFVSPTGRIIVYDSSGQDLPPDGDATDKAVQLLETLGFRVWAKMSTRSGIIVAEKAPTSSELENRRPVTILTTDSPYVQNLAEQCKVSFESSGFTSVQVRNIGRGLGLGHGELYPVPSTNSPLVLSLADLDDSAPAVYSLDSITFRPFIDTICNIRGSLVWVLPTVHTKQCKDARAAMIQGVVRTVRSEHRTDISLVETDEASLVSATLPPALARICQGLSTRRKGPLVDADYEYAVERGEIQVPRMQWSTAKSLSGSPPADESRGSVVDSTRQCPSTHVSDHTRFRADASYLLVGGLGGLGRAVATWMLEQGARSLIFLSRSAGSEKNANFTRELEAYPNAVISTVSGDVSSYNDVKKALEAAPTPIAGVMQLSLILRDAATTDMTFESWKEVIAPRIEGTLHLHNALLQAQAPLDFFIMFGSCSGVIGVWGQSNYSASNTFLDAFAHYRHGLGLPASTLDLGFVGEVGYVFEQPSVFQFFQSGGSYLLAEKEVLDAVAVAVSCGHDAELGGLGLGILVTKPLTDPSNRVTWKRDARFATSSCHHSFSKQSTETTDAGEAGGDEPKGKVAMFQNLARTDPAALKSKDTIVEMAQFIAAGISGILLQPIENISISDGLGEVGLDSLGSIELVDWIQSQFHIHVASIDVTSSTSLLHLAEKVLGGLERTST